MGPINGGPINLSSTRLRHASLCFATLTGAGLSAADLWDADLSDARLDRVNLAGADLSDALLDRADFAGTKLAGANLSSASLLEARNLTQAQIDEAMGNSSTVLPAYLARSAAWTGSVSPVSDYQTRSEFHGLGLNGVVAPKRVETVSWLVGGPRSKRDAAQEAPPSLTGRTV